MPPTKQRQSVAPASAQDIAKALKEAFGVQQDLNQLKSRVIDLDKQMSEFFGDCQAAVHRTSDGTQLVFKCWSGPNPPRYFSVVAHDAPQLAQWFESGFAQIIRVAQ